MWKYDHGSGFTSEIFQGLLEEHEIVPYPIAPHSPWVNGRKERDHQEVHNWLIPLVAAGREPSREELDREIDEEMHVRNFIKPRARSAGGWLRALSKRRLCWKRRTQPRSTRPENQGSVCIVRR